LRLAPPPLIVFPRETPEAVEQKKLAFQRMFDVRKVETVQTNTIAFALPDRRRSGPYCLPAKCVHTTEKGFEVALDEDTMLSQLIAYEWRRCGPNARFYVLKEFNRPGGSNVPQSYVKHKRDDEIIRLTEARGKTLESIDVSQSGEAISLDIHFHDGSMLEVNLQVQFRAWAVLLANQGGQLEVVKNGDLASCRRHNRNRHARI
jgi:hypothetical protein